MILTMVVLTGWVVPATNQVYREYAANRFNPIEARADNYRTWSLPKGMPELSLPELIRVITHGSDREQRQAATHVIGRAALVASVPVFFVFGIAVRRRLLGRTRWGIVRFVAGGSAVGVFLCASLVLAQLRTLLPAVAAWPDARGLTIWLTTFCLAAATVALARTANAEP